MNQTIGIIGLGFVGTAVAEGMKHAVSIAAYDKAKGCWQACENSPLCSKEVDEPMEWVTRQADLIFVCVPTPMNSDGSCNTSVVEGVINELQTSAQSLGRKPVVLIKSTVPPGTTEALDESCPDLYIGFNPEFLTEANPINDFKNQNRIVIGGSLEVHEVAGKLYDDAFPDVSLIHTTAKTAEMVKYTTNCYLAVKVAFANEMKQVCDKTGILYDEMIGIAKLDTRLGESHWRVPGPDGRAGFGGSCFPKDINGIMHVAQELGVDVNVLEGAWKTNLQVRPEKDWEQLVGRAVMS